MVNYPGKSSLPPYLANVPQRGPSRNPRELVFSRLRGSYVSKHRGGKKVEVVCVSDSFGADLALLFKTPLNEDLDGAPTSFAPPIALNNLAPRNGLVALDNIRNATDGGDNAFHQNGTGNSFHWTGVMSAPSGNIDNRDFLRDFDGNFPLLQPTTPASKAFYAPRTAMVGTNGQAVNPLTVAYAALSTSVRNNGHVALGDVGVAVRASTGTSTGFLYGDAGGRTSTSVGECSRLMIRNLFGGSATSEDICYIVFPGVSAGPPAHPERVDGLVRHRLARLAQFENFRSVIRNVLIPFVLDNVPNVEDTADFRNIMTALRARGFQPPT